MIDAAVALGETIASKSPVAVQGTKVHLVYARDHSAEESLEYEVITKSLLSGILRPKNFILLLPKM